MAFWGIELAESDEFCTPYDDFVDLFEIGEEPANIGAILLERYRNRYGSDEGIPSNVIFALAKAQWMFCAQSQEILDRVHEMIKNGTDIEYYRSLGFSEEDLTARRLALQKFWQSLQTPKTTVRKRRISPHNRTKRLPKGTVAWYEYKGDYFGFVVLELMENPASPYARERIYNALHIDWFFH